MVRVVERRFGYGTSCGIRGRSKSGTDGRRHEGKRVNRVKTGADHLKDARYGVRGQLR